MNTDMKLSDLVAIVSALGSGFKTSNQDFPLEVGTKVYLHTATFAYVGVLVEKGPTYLVLKEASWIADTGRFSAFAKGEFDDRSEIEVLPRDSLKVVAVGGLISAMPFLGELPKVSK